MIKPKFLKSFVALIVSAIFLWSCQGNEPEIEPIEETVEFSLNTELAAVFRQNIANGRAEESETFTGTLTLNNLDNGESASFDWFVVIDDVDFSATSNKTVAVVPGNYDLQLVVAATGKTYAGESNGITIGEGDNQVDVTLKPVFGQNNVDFTLSESANLRFSYPVNDIAEIQQPQIGLSIDGGDETIYSINKATGFTETWINLAFGSYTFELTLYDGDEIIGRSNPAQEDVNISANQNVVIDILPLFGEVGVSFNLEGGEVAFNFELPPAVAQEVGGVSNLQTILRLTSTVKG
jgi:hypothetical protein